MKKKMWGWILTACLLIGLLPGMALAQDTGRSYQFDLSVSGETTVYAATDEIITVTLKCRRTDSTEAAKMYGMQTEILYDSSFFELVEGSVETRSGVQWKDMARRTGGRAFYLNYVSLSGGSTWENEVVVGSFQLKVIGTSGSSSLTPENSKVSTEDGMDTYVVTDNAVTVTIVDQYTVTFDSQGGTQVASQQVKPGKTAADPGCQISRDGSRLEGWYTDPACTKQWNFEQDTVTGDLTLYGKWRKLDSTDVSKLLDLVADGAEIDPGYGDFDGNGTVDISDVSVLLGLVTTGD